MKYLNIFFFLLAINSGLNAQTLFVQHNNSISIEAEQYTSSHGEWEEVEGRNAEPAENLGQGIDYASNIYAENPINLGKNDVRIGWGIPYGNATVLAFADETKTKAAIFEYQGNTRVNDFIIPGYRLYTTWPTLDYNKDAWSYFFNILQKAVLLKAENSKLVYIHGGSTPNEIDTKIIQWLKSIKIDLVLLSDEKVKEHADFENQLIIISESIASNNVDDRFLKYPHPVIVGEPFILNKMRMVISKTPWEKVPGEYGNAIMMSNPQSSDSLCYAIRVTTQNKFKIYVLAQGADKRINENIIVKLYSTINNELITQCNLQLNSELTWVSGNEIDLIKGDYFLVLQPGKELFDTYKQYNDKRYPSFRIDKIVLTSDLNPISGNGPISKSIALPQKLEKNLKTSKYLPEQIWIAERGVAIIEAEAIDHHPNWELRQKPMGYTGEGYLSWQGPSRAQSIEMKGGNDDDMNIRQGPQEQMLIIRVQVEEDGIYCVNVRNIHELEDGDNDAWVSMIGFKPWNEDAFDDRVRRMGDSHKDGKGFTWLDWGVREFPLKKGINNLYIGGRSIGFGIDRIAIYPANDKEAMERALNIESPLCGKL